MQASLPERYEVELDELEIALHQLQNFDPAGVGPATCANACSCNSANWTTTLLVRWPATLSTSIWKSLPPGISCACAD